MTRRALLLGLVGLTILRLAWIGRLEFSPDEAYYLLWSERLDLAYYSKGPGIALLLRGVTSLLGTSEFAVRIPAPLLALATTILLFMLARRLFDEGTAVAAAVALQVMPIFNAGALLMTIDPLSIVLWLATLVLAWEALRRGSLAWWSFAGLACGAGILCKYTNALVLAGITLAVLLSPERRRHARGLIVMSLLATLATLPALIWNARHGWVTLTHLVERGALDRGAWLRPKESLEFMAVHFGTWSPLIFAAILAALPAAFRRARTDAGPRLLLAASGPILLMYAVLALHEAGEPNWTAPGILCLLPIAVAHWLPRIAASRAARNLAIVAIAVGATLSIAIVDTDIVRSAGIALPARSDPSTRLRGWTATANEVAQLRRTIERAEGDPILLVANHYGVASELAYYLPRAPIAAAGHPSVYVVPTAEPRNQFWFWPGLGDIPATFSGRSALFVTDRAQPPPDAMQDLFEGRCEPLDPIAIERGNDVLRTIRPWICRGLR